MSDFVVFNGSLYFRQGYLAKKKWLSGGGLGKRLDHLKIPALDLGLCSVGGATTGKYIECTRAVDVFPSEDCKKIWLPLCLQTMV